jgi:oligopeptidase A
MPGDAVEAAQAAATADGKTGWKFTLHMPSYLPVMQYADNRALRETLYRAYATRAAEFTEPDWDNTPLIAQILKIAAGGRAHAWFGSYAELSLMPKMAESLHRFWPSSMTLQLG